VEKETTSVVLNAFLDLTDMNAARIREKGRTSLETFLIIKPVAAQGYIGDVLPDKIIYDAQTTSGASGGPLFNDQAQVIGINFAMVRDLGGSNSRFPCELLLKP
jgi:S1-C subfamily serine protease